MRKLKHAEIPRIRPQTIPAVQRHPVSVLVDNVRSVHNVGSFFRTADGAWIEHLYLCGITASASHRGIHKTALGAQDSVPWSHHPDAHVVLQSLKEQGYTLAALEITSAPRLASSLDPGDFPLCLVVGNEIEGIQPSILDACDMALEIPQYGTKQSLNVSVALGIALLDTVRRYRSLHGLPILADPFPRPDHET